MRSKDRKRGGQPGHRGSGLERARDPDRTEQADPPAGCSGCGAELTGAADAGNSWTQIWDIPPIELEKVCWILPRRRCGCCRKTTTAAVPFGQPGAVVYGPNLNAAAVLLANEGNVPVERTATAIKALLGVPVSSRVRSPRPGTVRPAAGGGRVRCGDEDRAGRRTSDVRR